jgi:hypothetical protein
MGFFWHYSQRVVCPLVRALWYKLTQKLELEETVKFSGSFWCNLAASSLLGWI